MQSKIIVMVTLHSLSTNKRPDYATTQQSNNCPLALTSGQASAGCG